MEKIFFMVLILVGAIAGLVSADETNVTVPESQGTDTGNETVNNPVNIPVDETVRPVPQNVQRAAAAKKDELLNLEQTLMKQRLQNLEREITELEQENRFQDEKIRSLDRSVEDLRRRHVR